jgi:hypothetical protein
MHIGFVSTRFSGTDGVTLESSKWARLFQRRGFETYWFAGELDRDPVKGYLAPEAHFPTTRPTRPSTPQSWATAGGRPASRSAFTRYGPS